METKTKPAVRAAAKKTKGGNAANSVFVGILLLVALIFGVRSFLSPAAEGLVQILNSVPEGEEYEEIRRLLREYVPIKRSQEGIKKMLLEITKRKVEDLLALPNQELRSKIKEVFANLWLLCTLGELDCDEAASIIAQLYNSLDAPAIAAGALDELTEEVIKLSKICCPRLNQQLRMCIREFPVPLAEVIRRRNAGRDDN